MSQISEKDQKILSLQHDVKNLETPKSNANTQHINQLKTQISAMETEVGKFQARIAELQSDLDVARVDYQREKDINTFLVRKGLASMSENSPENAERTGNEYQSQNSNSARVNSDRRETQDQHMQRNEAAARQRDDNTNQKRDFCIHEFFSQTSCTFPPDACLITK